MWISRKVIFLSASEASPNRARSNPAPRIDASALTRTRAARSPRASLLSCLTLARRSSPALHSAEAEALYIGQR
jgi:hypothetical protein